MKHHTKDKGDIGVACVIANLMQNGIQVCLPISEHMPFDLIGVYPDGTLKRISVKYREISKRGTVEVALRSCYSDSKGAHNVEIDKDAIDMIAIYCPDNQKIYYTDHKEFNKSITLRVIPSRNNQSLGVNDADKYLVP